jgi:hypothetical protein
MRRAQESEQQEQLAHVLAREVQPESVAHHLAFAPPARSVVCLYRDVSSFVAIKGVVEGRLPLSCQRCIPGAADPARSSLVCFKALRRADQALRDPSPSYRKWQIQVSTLQHLAPLGFRSSPPSPLFPLARYSAPPAHTSLLCCTRDQEGARSNAAARAAPAPFLLSSGFRQRMMPPSAPLARLLSGICCCRTT